MSERNSANTGKRDEKHESAGAGTERQQAALLAHAEAILAEVEYGFPSWDPRHPAFDSKRCPIRA